MSENKPSRFNFDHMDEALISLQKHYLTIAEILKTVIEKSAEVDNPSEEQAIAMANAIRDALKATDAIIELSGLMLMRSQEKLRSFRQDINRTLVSIETIMADDGEAYLKAQQVLKELEKPEYLRIVKSDKPKPE